MEKIKYRINVDFPNTVMPKVTALGTVSFQAVVNGEYFWCEISCEALRVHFGAGSMDENALLTAFHQGRARIEERARHYLEADEDTEHNHPVLLMVRDF